MNAIARIRGRSHAVERLSKRESQTEQAELDQAAA
jgi:hypothetical protein